jgi:transglutaminase-like putative cysteine protease
MMTLDRRMTLISAIAVVLASTVIFPLFNGSTWFYAGIGAVVTVAAFGALSRIRTLPVIVCLAITLAGLLLYLNVAFEASRSFLKVIPTPASVTGLGKLVHAGMNEASKYAPGAPNVAGLVLLAAGGIGITAVCTDLIAVRLRSTALAGLPLLVLFTVPVTMTASRSGFATTSIFVLGTSGYLAMLSADGRERIRVWGRLISLWRMREDQLQLSQAGTKFAATGAVVSGNGNSASAAGAAARAGAAGAGKPAYRALRGPDTRALAAAGRRVGLASIVLALCAPVLIPGLHASKLFSSGWGFGSGNGSGTVTLPDPLSATASTLKETKISTVLTYTTNASQYLQQRYPLYLQQSVYDKLTDSASAPWQLQVPSTAAFDTELPPEEGLSDPLVPAVTTSITIAPGTGSSTPGIAFLPVPFPPAGISGARGTWLVEPSTLMILTKNGTLAAQAYEVTSLNVDASTQQLERAPATTSLNVETQLPPGYKSEQLLRLAEQHTAGAKNQFDAANDLATWLGGTEFTYNLYAQPIDSPASLVQFLTKTKIGDCVQSAFAFAVLARLLGIPTRIATGYTQGVLTGKDHYVVKSTDAHAWPEVYFQGFGWIRLEPTPPGQGSAQPAGYAVPAPASIAPPVLPAGGASAAPASRPGPNGKAKQLIGLGLGQGGAAAGKGSPGTPWTAIALAVLAAIALAGGVISLARPAAVRALAARPDSPREHSRLSITTTVVALVAAGGVALALYRLMSRTAGLNLGTAWATVGIAFGAACAVALVVPTACRVVLRRWRWMRARDDESRAHAAWHELRADLADFGVGYLPSESPRAVASRVATRLVLAEPAVEAVSRIALAEERASYAARPTDSATLREDGSTARRGIAAASGRAARLRSRVFPASVLSVLADGWARLADSWRNRAWLRGHPDQI